MLLSAVESQPQFDNFQDVVICLQTDTHTELT